MTSSFRDEDPVQEEEDGRLGGKQDLKSRNGNSGHPTRLYWYITNSINTVKSISI